MFENSDAYFDFSMLRKLKYGYISDGVNKLETSIEFGLYASHVPSRPLLRGVPVTAHADLFWRRRTESEPRSPVSIHVYMA